MKTQKKIVIGVVLICTFLGLVCVREFWQGIRDIKTDAYFKDLSTWIEIFRSDQEHYPRTLSDLLANDHEDEKGKQAIQRLLNEIQNNPWHDNYDYSASTNGFTIVVTGPELPPAGWFGKRRTIEKHYAIGEALKQ